MANMTEQMRTTLIATVQTVRNYRGSMSESTLFRRGVNERVFQSARKFISRTDIRGEQSQGVVGCIQVAPRQVGINTIYNCRQCPLLIGGKCDAGQEVRIGVTDDSRDYGPGRPPIKYGKQSRKPPMQ